MAEPEFGPACPGCTPEIITARIARFPAAYVACVPCRDRGALHHAQQKREQHNEQETAGKPEDAQERVRRPSGPKNRKADAKS